MKGGAVVVDTGGYSRAFDPSQSSEGPVSEEVVIRECLRRGVFVPADQLRAVVYGTVTPQVDEEFVSASVIRPGDRIRLREVHHFFDGVAELPNGVDYVEVWNIEWGNPFTIDHPYGSITVPENFPVIRVHEYNADVHAADAGVDLPGALSRGKLSDAEAIAAARRLLHTLPGDASVAYPGLSRFARTGEVPDIPRVLDELVRLPRAVDPLAPLFQNYLRALD